MSCPDCISGAFLPGEPAGAFELHGAYHASPPATATEAQTKRAIVLLTDAFGLPLKNCKIIADRLAERLCCDVWVPDMFAGKCYSGKPLMSVDLMMPGRAGEKMGFLHWLRFIWLLLIRVPYVVANRPAVVDRRLLAFLDSLESQRTYDKVGAVGYCFGGATVVRLGATGRIHSAVVCHPAPFTIDQLKALKAPTSWVWPEDDIFVKAADLSLQVEAVFSERKGKDTFIDYECKEYKGTTHGFASRPELKYPEIKEAFEKAFDQTVEWFNKTLVVP
ncbi:dienelactone hydrolase endo-1,3,1,4-beta-D-glucanase [Roridomyces roridus]|uniref:Dienelactone hydrolase endo-1,3,1,4-beta-D-glucanase n=1 Tax=Roridomyces roridus TaxID=1738132 RepID=A0AAD7BZ78_9AGAR|nr:dienelactone hydrolase endo-1,3,1,4-beta-D-glucanase [Roridomyces roridus]